MTHHAVPESAWIKSSHSAENATACVEVADLGGAAGRIAVRDSKFRHGPLLSVCRTGFAGFVCSLRRGGPARRPPPG